MIGEYGSTGRQTCSSAPLSITDISLTCRASDPGDIGLNQNLDTGFLSWFPCVLEANAEVVPKYPRCHYMLLM